jgi:hypothetical protein
MTLALVLVLAFFDLAAVKAEPDVNRRSEMALANADEKLEAAREAYRVGNDAAEAADIQEVGDSIVLCYESLEQSHEAPRKSRYYKRAELKVSALMRRLSGFRDEVTFDLRPKVDMVLKQVSDIHDQLLSDIMSKKK